MAKQFFDRIQNISVKLKWINAVIIGCLIIFSLIFVTASPLNKGNGWVDTNAMLSVGSYWLDGQVPYLDFFEQRGPVMFAYYLVANMVSRQGYFGIFLIETANLIACWWMSVRIFELRVRNHPIMCRFVALGVPFLFVGSFAFEFGGSPEEFVSLWILIGIYAWQSFELNRMPANKSGWLLGLSFIMTFWIKYSLIGPWVAIAICALIRLIKFKQWVAMRQLIINAALGIVSVTAIICAYFFAVQGFDALTNIYFKTNLTAYGSGNIGLRHTVVRSLRIFKQGFVHHPHLFDAFLASLLVQFILLRRYWFAVEISIMTIIAAVLAFWSGGDNVYLFLPIVMIVGVFIIQTFLELLIRLKRPGKFLAVASLLLLFVLPRWSNPYTVSMPRIWQEGQPVAAQLAQTIKRDRLTNPRLLYVNTVDWGVGRYVNLQQPDYIFEHTNVDDQKYRRQPRSIAGQLKTQKPEYLVWGLTWGNSPAVDLQNEQLVLERLPKEVTDKYKVVKVATSPTPRQGAMQLVPAGEDQLVLLKARRLIR